MTRRSSYTTLTDATPKRAVPTEEMVRRAVLLGPPGRAVTLAEPAGIKASDAGSQAGGGGVGTRQPPIVTPSRTRHFAHWSVLATSR